MRPALLRCLTFALALALPGGVEAQATAGDGAPTPGARVRMYRRDAAARDGLHREQGTLVRAGADSVIVRGPQGARTAWAADSVLFLQEGRTRRGSRTRVLQAAGIGGGVALIAFRISQTPKMKECLDDPDCDPDENLAAEYGLAALGAGVGALVGSRLSHTEWHTVAHRAPHADSTAVTVAATPPTAWARPGVRVRVHVRVGDATTFHEGALQRLDADSIVVHDGGGVRAVALDRVLFVEHGTPQAFAGSRALRGLGMGAAIGGGVGLAAGLLAVADDGHCDYDCSGGFDGLVVVASMTVGTIAGAAIGGIVGAATPGHDWRTVPHRLEGASVAPTLRGGGLGVRVALRF